VGRLAKSREVRQLRDSHRHRQRAWGGHAGDRNSDAVHRSHSYFHRKLSVFVPRAEPRREQRDPEQQWISCGHLLPLREIPGRHALLCEHLSEDYIHDSITVVGWIPKGSPRAALWFGRCAGPAKPMAKRRWLERLLHPHDRKRESSTKWQLQRFCL